MVRHPRGSYTYPIITVSGRGHTRKQINSFEAVIYCKFASQEFLGRMQLVLHATRRPPNAASRLVQAISAWSMKTRRAPSRHCRDARVYSDTTNARHEHTSKKGMRKFNNAIYGQNVESPGTLMVSIRSRSSAPFPKICEVIDQRTKANTNEYPPPPPIVSRTW